MALVASLDCQDEDIRSQPLASRQAAMSKDQVSILTSEVAKAAMAKLMRACTRQTGRPL